MKGILFLSSLLIAPIAALRLPAPVAALKSAKDYTKILSKQELILADDNFRAERIIKKVSKSPTHSWVVFMGDSNMRNAYYWWTMTKLKPMAKNFWTTREFGDFWRPDSNEHFNASYKTGAEWSDQDFIVERQDGTKIRSSFRFLHGSSEEFKFKVTHWNSLQRANGGTIATPDKDKIMIAQESEQAKQDSAFQMDDSNAIVPSPFAQWAAKHQTEINVSKTRPEMAAQMKEFFRLTPDASFITEGWGGSPGCNRFDDTLNQFKAQPNTKFVYSPVFATNRVQSRQDCYFDKIAKVPKSPQANFRFVYMWDIAGTMPMYHEIAGKEHVKHIGMGSTYMKVGLKRFEDAIEDLAQ